jgi:sn-glycerol 3-phosphate transport system permease protein
MIEKTPWLDRFTYVTIFIGILILCFPVYYMFVASTLSLNEVSQVPLPLLPGRSFFENIHMAWTQGQLGPKMFNSFVVSLGITIGKISISIMSAFAIAYFDFPLRKTFFWMIFVTLMLPVEVRILPTYEVAANVFAPLHFLLSLFPIEIGLDWSLLNTYTGLILPLIASATATFLFRQFFLTIPDELCEASKIDGLSPMGFFWRILFPLSKTNIAALTVIIFVYGWNQYLWPLLITTKPEMGTALIAVQSLIPKADDIPRWNVAMAAAFIVMLPPILVVLFMQKWFVKGLIENEK